MLKKLLLALALTTTSHAIIFASNLEQLNNKLQDTIYTIQKNLGYDDRALNKLSDRDHFTEDEIGKVLEILCKHKYANTLSQDEQNELKKLKTNFVDKLKEYKVSGVSFCVDPNAAFIYDNQNPQFTVAFKNANGEIKTRTYQGSITSLGLKGQLAIKLNLIFFVGTDLDFYNSNKTIELGTGIDLSIPIPVPGVKLKDGIGMPGDLALYSFTKGFFGMQRELSNDPHFRSGMSVEQLNNLERELNNIYAHFPLDFMYVPFKNTSGGMIMLSFPLRLFAPWALSMVTGGSLTPCK